MANILDDAKVASMIGDVNNGLSQVRPAVNQLEQYNSLAQNIKEILQMVMNRQQGANAPNAQQQQFAQPNPVVMQNTAPVQMVAPTPPANNPQIVVDIPLVKQKVMQFKEQINLFPEGVRQMTLQQIAETSPEAINNFIDMYVNQIAQEIKGCVKLQ